MLEHRTAQDGLASQAMATAAGGASNAAADHIEQFGVLIEPFRRAFQFGGDGMDNLGRLKYAGLDGAGVAHRDLRCFGYCCGFLQAMIAETPFFCPPVRINSSPFNNLRVYGQELARLIRDGESAAADALLKWLRSRKLESDTLIGLGIIDAFDLSSFFDGDRVATAVSAPSIASDYLIRRNFEVASGLSPFRYQVSPGPRATLPSHQEAWFSQYKYQAVPPYFSLILAQLEDASEYPFLSRWEHDWRWIQATYPRPKPNPFFFHREHETGQLDLGLTEVYRSSYLRTFAHAVLLHHITSDEAEGKALHTLTMNRGLADVEPIDRPSWARAPVPLSGHHTHRVVRELWASARAAAGPSEVPAALRAFCKIPKTARIRGRAG